MHCWLGFGKTFPISYEDWKSGNPVNIERIVEALKIGVQLTRADYFFRSFLHRDLRFPLLSSIYSWKCEKWILKQWLKLHIKQGFIAQITTTFSTIPSKLRVKSLSNRYLQPVFSTEPCNQFKPAQNPHLGPRNFRKLGNSKNVHTLSPLGAIFRPRPTVVPRRNEEWRGCPLP